jgi:hypothetical protein
MDRNMKDQPFFHRGWTDSEKKEQTHQHTERKVLLKFAAHVNDFQKEIEETNIYPREIHSLSPSSQFIFSPMIQRGQAQYSHKKGKIVEP